MAGLAKLMHAYAMALKKADHTIHFASGEYPSELERDVFVHITIDGLRTGSRDLLVVPTNVMKVASLIARGRTSVVSSFNAHTGLLAYFADPLDRVKHFNAVLGTGHEWTKKFLSSWIFSGKIVAVSNDVRDRLESGQGRGGLQLNTGR